MEEPALNLVGVKRADITKAKALESFLVVIPRVDVGGEPGPSRLGGTGRGSSVVRRLGRQLAAVGLVLTGLFGLVFGLASWSGGSVAEREKGRQLDSRAIVVVNSPHLIS